MTFNNHYYKTLTVWLVFCLCSVYCFSFPAKPDISGINPYFSEEIERTWLFLRTRPDNPELTLKMAIILDEIGAQDQAKIWFNHFEQLGLSAEKAEELNQKIRKQLNFQMTPIPAKILEPDQVEIASPPENQRDIIAMAEANNNMILAAQEYYKLFQNSRKPEYLSLCAERYLWANRSDLALEKLVELEKLQPRNRQLLEQIAQIYQWHSRFDISADYLYRSLSLKYRRHTHQQLIKTLYDARKFNEAETEFHRYLKKFPEDEEIKEFFSRFLLEMQRPDDALRLIESMNLEKLPAERLVNLLQPVNSVGKNEVLLKICKNLEKRKMTSLQRLKQTFFLTSALAGLKKNQEAWIALDILEKNLETPGLKMPVQEKSNFILNSLLIRARLAHELNFPGVESETHKKILEIDPGNLSSLLFLAEESSKNGDLKVAEKLFQTALRKDPENSWIIWSMADIANRSGNLYTARKLMEHLTGKPDFFDERAILKIWHQTSAWKKLADHIESNQSRLFPEFSDYLVEALKNIGQIEKAAAILISRLIDNPFDENSEKLLQQISEKKPSIWHDYSARKNFFIDGYHQNLIASLTDQIAASPENSRFIHQRAKVYGYMNRPADALSDLLTVIASSPVDLELINEAAGMAEWAANLRQASRLRQQIMKISPDDAGNALKLSSLMFNQREFSTARKILEKAEDFARQNPKEYFSAAMPILIQSGSYKKARDLVEHTKENTNETDNERHFSKTLNEYSKIVSRDLGPISRIGFSFTHDTDSISHSNTIFQSRFNVENHGFHHLQINDIAMTRDNNNHHGIRAREIFYNISRSNSTDKINIGVPFLAKEDKLQLFLPSVSFLKQLPDREFAFDFKQLPVKDTPEAIHQGLFSNQASFSIRKKLAGRSWVNLNAGLKKNSAGYSGNFAGITFEKAISYAPFSSWRYSFFTEDNQSENSDEFYLEDFIQTHTLAWTGQHDFFQSNRLLDQLNWDIYGGINNRKETFYGASLNFEKKLRKSLFLIGNTGFYSSKNNRFAQTGGYNNWTYGLSLENRSW
ncbi:MAG: tetratricopeptide repeat protein [Candidatus Rifleibacteriota bacterium]